MNCRTFIFFDSEFVCSKEGILPIQISLRTYNLENNTFTYLNSFNVYIKPKSPKKLNKYFIKYTGITYDLLKEKGISFISAKKEIKKYIKDLNLKETIFIGWDIHNDLDVLNILTKSIFFNFKKILFMDLSNVYSNIVKSKNHISLTDACNKNLLTSACWHNASEDAKMTYELFDKIIKKSDIDLLINKYSYRYKK